MCRPMRRILLTSLMVGASLLACDDSSDSDPDGSVGQRDASQLQSKDAGYPDHFESGQHSEPDAGNLLGEVPVCDASVQRGAPCTAGPTSACVPASGAVVCLCPTGTWVCF
jgi:hypothetical protein